jgi:hypothetical protein
MQGGFGCPNTWVDGHTSFWGMNESIGPDNGLVQF